MLLKNYLFHRVSDEADLQWPPMKPFMFESIIRQLIKKNKVVLLEDILLNPEAFSKKSNQYVTISFDDGYKDNIDFAAPILKKNNCPASFYIVTNSIDTNTPTWTYLVDFIISNTKKEKIEFPFSEVPEQMKIIHLQSGKNLFQSVKKIKPWLKTLSNLQRTGMINQILSQCNDVVLPTGQMMSWSDINQLKSDGYYIGSHSHTHPMLASLESEAEIKNELDISSKRISDETGTAPVTISYPVGSYDERVVRLAKESGYLYGLAVEQNFFKYNSGKLFSIPRMELYQEPAWKAQLRINGVISTVKNIWRR
jgi:peptidoglycan/xylan/chitin deacetylase (PgdA/CDA1 family)